MEVVFCGAMKSPHLLPRDFMVNEGKTSVGYNTGNFIIGEYGRRTIQGDACFECGFPWSIPMPAEEFNEKFDHLVIFAANWLAHYMKYDFSPAIEWLKKIKVPVTLIGLGAQFDMKNLNKAEYVKNLEPSLVKLFQVIATKNKSISTRGYITAELLHEIGVDNTNVTGCPTWFVNGNKQQPLVKKDFSQNFKISMHADVSNLHAYARLYDLAKGVKDKTYILQSEFDLIPLILGDKINAEGLKKKYMLRDEIINQPEWGHIFGNLTDWENYVKSRDLVIGMRIHGTIIALKNNTPAILFYHDGRTFEFVDVFDLPHWKIDDLFDESKTLEYFYEKTDFTKMNKKYHFLLANYKLFLQENGIVFHENNE